MYCREFTHFLKYFLQAQIMRRCTKIDKYEVCQCIALSINVRHCVPTSMDEGGGVDKGGSVVNGVVSQGGWRGEGFFGRNPTQC